MVKKIRRLAFIALVAFLTTAQAMPAGAESLSTARKRRDSARVQRAKVASELNTLKASDVELENAVKALNVDVAAKEAEADDARQAVQSALAEVAKAEAELAATNAKASKLKDAVVGRAVAAYVSPQDREMITNIANAKNFNEASRRSQLLEQIADHDRNILDELREVKEDQTHLRKEAEAARDEAQKRQAEQEARLAAARRIQGEKVRLSNALNARISEYVTKADAISAEEAQLSGLIRSKESALAAQASRSSSIEPGEIRRGTGELIWPVNGPVTSGYGYRWGRMHSGIDIGARSGTPIRAAKSGVVIFVGNMGGYGNTVIVDHGGGFTTLYAHQSRFGSSDGQSVGQGDVIGYVGSTGNSTGPHLHFETRVNGNPQNPRNYL